MIKQIACFNEIDNFLTACHNSKEVKLPEKLTHISQVFHSLVTNAPPFLCKEAEKIEKMWDEVRQDIEQDKISDTEVEQLQTKVQLFSCKYLINNWVEESTPSSQQPISEKTFQKALKTFENDDLVKNYPHIFSGLASVIWKMDSGQYGKNFQMLIQASSPEVLLPENILKFLLFEGVFEQDKNLKTLLASQNLSHDNLYNIFVGNKSLSESEQSLDILLNSGLKSLPIPRPDAVKLMHLSQQFSSSSGLAKLCKKLADRDEDLDSCLELCSHIDDKTKREGIEKLLSSKLWHESQQLLKEGREKEAADRAVKIPTPSFRKEVLQFLASVHFYMITDPNMASSMVKEFDEEFDHDIDILAEKEKSKCKGLQQQGQLDETLDFAGCLLNRFDKDQVHNDLAMAFLEKKLWRKALDTASMVQEDEWKCELQQSGIMGLLSEGKTAEALEASRENSYPQFFARMLIEIAKKDFEMGNDGPIAALFPLFPKEYDWRDSLIEQLRSIPSTSGQPTSERVEAILKKVALNT